MASPLTVRSLRGGAEMTWAILPTTRREVWFETRMCGPKRDLSAKLESRRFSFGVGFSTPSVFQKSCCNIASCGGCLDSNVRRQGTSIGERGTVVTFTSWIAKEHSITLRTFHLLPIESRTSMGSMNVSILHMGRFDQESAFL